MLVSVWPIAVKQAAMTTQEAISRQSWLRAAEGEGAVNFTAERRGADAREAQRAEVPE